MNTPSPLISVVMPVYNRKKYLSLAVESILQQSFDDFEFIIIDDGSTDGASDVLRHYATQDSRVRLVEQENSGYAIALNRGIQRAKGQFLARMDSDDISLPDRFALQLEFLRSNPHIVVVGGQALRIDEDGDPLSPMVQLTDSSEIEQKLIGAIESNRGGLVHPSVMMRKDAVDTVGGYRPGFEPAEDRDLWLRLAEVGQLANLPHTVLHYRTHSESVSQERSAQQHANATRAIHDAYRRREQQIPETIHIWKLQDYPSSDAKTRGRYALTAARNRYYRTARKHARRALAAEPLNRHAWKAMVISLLGVELTTPSGYRQARGALLCDDK
ncbi:MAG: glycosyltransferase [Candidatus Paceibacterota bacterium]